MSNYLRPNTGVTITVAASDKLATYSQGNYSVSQVVGYPNIPETEDVLFSSSGANLTSAFTNATEVTIQAGDYGLYYQTGTAPVVLENPATGNTATAVNATATVTLEETTGGIITSTTASAVTGTLETGAVIDGKCDFAVGDFWDWSVINTGGSNAFTVTAAASGHTVVGDGVCVTGTSCMYRTVKTAAETYVTYVLSSAAS